jgi:DNA-binding transcriptional regulator YdaS (Cro superfamily)
MKHRGKTRSVLCIAFAITALMAVSSTGANAAPRVATQAQPASAREIQRAKRAIASIAVHREACRNREEFPTPASLQDCDGAAIQAYDKLLPRARTHALRQALLAEMVGLFQEAINPDRAYYPNYALADIVVAVANYADLARRRAEILTGAVPAVPSRRAVRGRSGLFDWIDRTPDLRAAIHDDTLTTRTVTRRWTAIRDADCAAYPVPRCAERLDDAMRDMIRELTKEEPSSFKKGEVRPPRRFEQKGRP